MNGAWASSEALDALAGALVGALSECGDIARTRRATIPGRNGASGYSYEYADLSDVLGEVRPIFSRHGLAIIQTATTLEGGNEVEVWTTFIHSSGQWMTHQPFRLPLGNTAQQAGSAVTYARRYALMASLGLATLDDDGESAGSREAPAPRQSTRRQSQAPRREQRTHRTPAEAAIHSVFAGLDPTVGRAIRDTFRQHFGSGLSDLPPERHSEALAWVQVEAGLVESSNRQEAEREAADEADAEVERAAAMLADAGIGAAPADDDAADGYG